MSAPKFTASTFTYAKWFAGGQRTLFEHKEGPIRVALIAAGAASPLFGNLPQAEKNQMLRSAMMAAGRFWVDVFLPKRFTDYAVRLGYRPSAQWVAFKEKLYGQAIPLVQIGQTRSAALNGARVSAIATANKTQIRIGIPLGHAVQKNTARFIYRVPPWEMQRLAEEAGKALKDILGGVFVEADGRARPKAAVPLSLRPKVAATVERGPAHRPRRSA